MFENNNFNDNKIIAFLERYYPIRSAEFQGHKWSHLALDLKESDRDAKQAFLTRINLSLINQPGNKFYICHPPSSQPGIHDFVHHYVASANRIAIDMFTSTHSIQSHSASTRPTLQEKIDSLNVITTQLDHLFPILIIDDVITYGTTLLACKQILCRIFPYRPIYAMALSSARGEFSVGNDIFIRQYQS